MRDGTRADVDAALEVWRASVIARDGRPVPSGAEGRARASLAAADAFLVVAEDAGRAVGMAAGMDARLDDGAGAPIAGLCHVAMVFVAPDWWGEGTGGRLLDRLLEQARARGYARAQLWTQAHNARASRLYEARAFRRSGREKQDDSGDRIAHYERAL